MMGSSQRAWWKRRGMGLGAMACFARTVIGAPPEGLDQTVDLGLGADLGHRVQRALAEFGELAGEVGAAEIPPFQQPSMLISATVLPGRAEVDHELVDVVAVGEGEPDTGQLRQPLHRVAGARHHALAQLGHALRAP